MIQYGGGKIISEKPSLPSNTKEILSIRTKEQSEGKFLILCNPDWISNEELEAAFFEYGKGLTNFLYVLDCVSYYSTDRIDLLEGYTLLPQLLHPFDPDFFLSQNSLAF